MNTKFVGIKDFRQNISDYAKLAQKGDAQFVIMKRNKPLFEIKPFAEDVYLDSFAASMVEAEADISANRVIPHDDLAKKLGLG